MGWDFLVNNGGRRMRDPGEQPVLLGDAALQVEDSGVAAARGYEREESDWKPLDVADGSELAGWDLRPVRYVDGKDVGQTVAWLRSPEEGYPVPVRLSQIGAVVMRDVGGGLQREDSPRVERVVSLMVDFFPWEEVESFAAALQAAGFRLLACRQPPRDTNWFDFERMRKTTQNRSNDEMIRLERLALGRESGTPTLVDGRLEPRFGAFDEAQDPVVGLIKTHSENYLHPQGWRTLYALQPGQRTPVFQLTRRPEPADEGEPGPAESQPIISWYLRLVGGDGELPNSGIVRLEIPEPCFRERLSRDWGYVNRVSRSVLECRCRDRSYGRAAISIYPIQRAEESLGALFSDLDALISRFYRLGQL